MKYRIPISCLLLVLAAQTALAIDIFVRNPRDGQPVFGLVDVVFEVLSSEPIVEVEVLLDGEVAGRVEKPPYMVRLDVGQENRSHTIEIKATDAKGETATRTITTGVIEVNMELDLELQQLFVTATRGGQRALDLERDFFEIFDNNRRQEMVTFERGDVPLTAVLLIDSSLSMEGEALKTALTGARTFVENMQELDEAKVIVFSDQMLATTPFTGDPRLVASVMDDVTAVGGTAINDHLYLALKELDAQPGRQVVVLLSDGIDIESVLDMNDVAWKAGRMQSLIYWIRPTFGADPNDSFFSVWRDSEAHRTEIESLENLVISSGGRIREIDHINQAASAFREILQELREQYVLGYYPSSNENDGSWHDVKVRVRASGIRVRARGGYFDDQM